MTDFTCSIRLPVDCHRSLLPKIAQLSESDRLCKAGVLIVGLSETAWSIGLTSTCQLCLFCCFDRDLAPVIIFHSCHRHVCVIGMCVQHAGPACWLWDYLRRSGASGYMLPLSGGADSSATAAIMGCMTQLVTKAVDAGDKLVEADARRSDLLLCVTVVAAQGVWLGAQPLGFTLNVSACSSQSWRYACTVSHVYAAKA